MGASRAVILANLWLKNYEKVLAMDIPRKIVILEDMNEKCSKSNRRLTFRIKAVEFEDCLNRYHKGCGGFSEEDYKGI